MTYTVLTDVLNDDVIGIIKGMLPPEKRVWLSRADYIENHWVVKKMIPQPFYDSYIHDIIRHDCSFVFTQILQEQFAKFHAWKDFSKGGNRHHSYLTYLMDYCIDVGATRCATAIDTVAEQKGFSENWYKRRGVILSSNNKRWRT